MQVDTERLDAIRFRLEKFEIEKLCSKYAFTPDPSPPWLVDHHREILSSGLKITERMSPKLWNAFRESIEALNFREPVELFVINNSEWNAKAVARTESTPHKVLLHSGIVRHHSPEELKFVIGHELGHLAFRHHHGFQLKSRFPPTPEGRPTVPVFLDRRLTVWGRWAEASCDRAGFAAAGGNMAAVTNAVLALASGLGPEWVIASEEDLEKQLAEIESAKIGDHAHTSHPGPLVRLAALRHYSRLSDWNALDEKDRQFSDTETFRILSLHDTTSSGVSEHVITFVVVACVLATRARNSGMTPEERDNVLNWIADLTDDPETYLEAGLAATNAELETMLMESAAELRNDPDEAHCELLIAMVGLIVADGTCSDDERRVARLASEALGLGPKTVDFIIHQELANQRRRGTGNPS